MFCEHYASIKQAVIRLVESEFPDALANASYRIIEADAENPAILLRTTDLTRSASRHGISRSSHA